MSTTSSEKAARSANILLVDDHKLGLSARKIVLQELGYSITASSCAHEALEHLTKSKFDLLVTDYKMPRMDGVQLIARVREDNPALPIILISGFADTLGLDEATTGADVVIQKSNHEVTALIRAVNRLLTRKPARKPVASQKAAPKAKRQTV